MIACHAYTMSSAVVGYRPAKTSNPCCQPFQTLLNDSKLTPVKADPANLVNPLVPTTLCGKILNSLGRDI